MKLISFVTATILLGGLPAFGADASMIEIQQTRNVAIYDKSKKVKQCLYDSEEFKNLIPDDKHNLTILADNIEPAPLKFIPAEDIVKRLVKAYKDNVAVHSDLREEADIQTEKIDFEKVLKNLRYPRKKPRSKKKANKLMTWRLGSCLPYWGDLLSLERRYREAQLELNYFASPEAIKQVNGNLGFGPVSDWYLMPATNFPPATK